MIALKNTLILLFSVFLFQCDGTAQQKKETESSFKVTKSDAQWKQDLSPLAYNVMRKAATERPFSSPLNKENRKGTYSCAACDTPLFKGQYKFDSGTGWPSFDREIKGNVAFSVDYELGHARTEEHCATCGGHLGHVFNDGPSETTGKRHCINGVALKFIPEHE
ncbi:peptide-methionine (R)-S-oxide reductase MsrB [Bizionia paragorgiae]|uniref:peptide-methionine (R)-S-oxide reductase MsrB n=1 Tax=Bizionia paragorgiae TaxID=283786 RepID=UPI003A90AE21